MNIPTSFLIGGILLIIGFGLVISYLILRLPRNNPQKFLQKIASQSPSQTHKLVAVGDSITHGTLSANYVDLLSECLNREQVRVEVINAGVNGNHSYHVLNRTNEIIRCRPDFITILIGTNDVASSIRPSTRSILFSRIKLPQPSTLAFFTSNLQSLVSRFKAQTQAKIAILSLPPIGEDLNQPITQASIAFSRAIQDVAEHQSVEYLPLQEVMLEYLTLYPAHPKFGYEQHHMVFVRGLIRRLLGYSNQRISETLGFRLHIDFYHLNDLGANMIVDLIEEFYLKHQAR
jgi:lysophospholipase L1-like esterase